MQVPFLDLKTQYKAIKQEIDEAIADVIKETAFVGGEYVKNRCKKDESARYEGIFQLAPGKSDIVDQL
jgi:hypothetical protein